VSFDVETMAVAADGDEAVLVGAVNHGVMLAETLENIAVGVAVAVIDAH
jgi:hypothetical protein